MARKSKSLDKLLTKENTEEIWNLIKERGFTRSKDGCLEYNGYRNENGYGQLRYGRLGKLWRVHRIAYAQAYGELPPELVVMHLCDNPSCSEPSHLKKATQIENIKDMFLKKRDGKADLKVCVNGHEYPPDRPKYINKNRCRVCANERNRRYHARKKELALV